MREQGRLAPLGRGYGLPRLTNFEGRSVIAHTAEMQRYIQECLDCHRTCEETIAYCLEQGATNVAPAHIRLLMDCA